MDGEQSGGLSAEPAGFLVAEVEGAEGQVVIAELIAKELDDTSSVFEKKRLDERR